MHFLFTLASFSHRVGDQRTTNASGNVYRTINGHDNIIMLSPVLSLSLDGTPSLLVTKFRSPPDINFGPVLLLVIVSKASLTYTVVFHKYGLRNHTRT